MHSQLKINIALENLAKCEMFVVIWFAVKLSATEIHRKSTEIFGSNMRRGYKGYYCTGPSEKRHLFINSVLTASLEVGGKTGKLKKFNNTVKSQGILIKA